MMDLYIARHAETFGNIGQQDVPDPALTPIGCAQAEALGAHMAQFSPAAIFASPLLRSVQTAAAVARHAEHKVIEILPELVEAGLPRSFVPLSQDALQEVYPHLRFLPGELCTEETSEQSYARAVGVVRRLRARFPQRETCVFIAGHGAYNNYLLLAAAGLPLQTHFNFSQQNASLSLIRIIPREDCTHTKIGFANRTEHLPPELITGL